MPQSVLLVERMDLKETILERVNIAELIGQYVTLVRSGNNEFKACCPFHNEKTPSFNVVPAKRMYHCFGCKAGGNVIDFVMARENLEFYPAMEFLAGRYGIEIPQYNPGQKREKSAKQRMQELNQAAQKYYAGKLQSPDGELARSYLKKRGIDPEVAMQFELGYAPKEWSSLTDLLLAKNVKSSELDAISLARPRSQGGGYYDFFRHRLIFPIHDVMGRNVVGFGGRALSDEDNPKYLNTGATPLYEKSKVLYNLNRARSVARDEGIVVTEGYMDVIGLAQHGVANAVATCGTALTPEHVAQIRSYTERVYLAFDGDNAGRSAAWKAGKLFLGEGIDARVVVIPGGMDPDDFVRERGNAAWKGLLSESRGVVQFWLEHQLAAHPDADLPLRRAWIAELRPLYMGISDELLREDIRRQLADHLLLRPEIVSQLLSGNVQPRQAGRAIDKQRLAQDRYRKLQREERRKGLVNIRPGWTEDVEESEQLHRRALVEDARNRAAMQGSQPVEREVLRRLATDDEFRFIYLRIAQPEWFVNGLHREIYNALLLEQEKPDRVVHDDRWRRFFAELLSRPQEEEQESSADMLIRRHCNIFLERRVAELLREMKQEEQRGNHERVQQLTIELLDTKKQIRPVQGIGGMN